MPRMTQEQLQRLEERAARYNVSVNELSVKRVKKGVVKVFIDFRSRVPGVNCIFRHEMKVDRSGHVFDNVCVAR